MQLLAEHIARRSRQLAHDVVPDGQILKDENSVLAGGRRHERALLGELYGVAAEQAEQRTGQGFAVFVELHARNGAVLQLVHYGLTVVDRHVYKRRVLTGVCELDRVALVAEYVVAVRGVLLHIVAAQRQITCEGRRPVGIYGGYFYEPVCRDNAAVCLSDVGCRVESEADRGNLAVRADAELLIRCHGFAQRNPHPLALIEERGLELGKTDVLPGVGQLYCLRLGVQNHAVGRRRLGNDVLAKIQLLARSCSVRPGSYSVDHRAGRYAHAAVRSEYVLGG